MWESQLPAVDDVLRQGDLITGVPFPKRGGVRLEADGIIANMYPAEPVLVLDQCCTVDQRHTVLLGRVRQTVRQKPGDPFYEALLNTTFEAGKPVSKYAHLLHDPPGLKASGRMWAVDFVKRFSYAAKNAEDLAWLQEKRVARMTPVARAHVRLKLQYHFAEVAEEDVEALKAQGLDRHGRSLKST